MPHYLDVGTGSSNWTWQAPLGVGYAFDWGEVNLSRSATSPTTSTPRMMLICV
jgi:hypothetical protein